MQMIYPRQITPPLQRTISVVVVLLWILPVLGPNPGKAVFLRGNDVVTANGDGSDVKILTSDNDPKRNPVWSPDSEKIAYLIPGTKSLNPQTHAKIAIIDSTGVPQTVVPVLSTEADGTTIGGMRFVEEFGWFGNGAVFAMGSVNPHIAEYRVLDAGSSKVIQSYFGYEFATCPNQPQVAYGADGLANDSKGVHIELQGTPVYSAPQDSILRSLRWSADCRRLAFFQAERGKEELVVLHCADHSVKVEAHLPLHKEWTNLAITPVANSFLLSSHAASLAYDSASRSLRYAPEIMAELQAQKQRRDLLIHNLNGRSPNWWPGAD